MKLKRCLGWSCAAACAALGAMALLKLTSAPPPENIVLITIDALRRDHLGCYGYRRATSPAIDRIAAESSLFRRAITAGAWTPPSITSLMSSTDPAMHGVLQLETPIPPRLPLLAEVLKRRGFNTAAFVHQAGLSIPGQGFARGFDSWRASYAKACANEAQYAGDTALTEDAVQWLEERPPGRFFLWLHYMNPHAPYTPPPRYRRVFENDAFSGERRLVPAGEDYCFGLLPAWTRAPVFERRDVAYFVSQYDGEIRFADDQVRRIMESLRRRGVFDRTVVVITADHGESLGENDWYFDHAVASEPVIRVPLIIRMPGGARGRRIAPLVSLLDVAPTLCDIFHIPPPATFEGHTLLPLMRGSTVPVRENAFGVGNVLDQRYLRGIRYKCVISRPPDDFRAWECHRGLLRERFGDAPESLELFDLASDPYEGKNIAPEKPDLAFALRTLIEEHFAAEENRAQPISPPAAPLSIDEKTRKILKSLGYLK